MVMMSDLHRKTNMFELPTNSSRFATSNWKHMDEIIPERLCHLRNFVPAVLNVNMSITESIVVATF
jgi:hypothetical protein